MQRPRSLEDLEDFDLNALDEEELDLLIRWVRRECHHRYEHASRMYGVWCAAGKKRY